MQKQLGTWLVIGALMMSCAASVTAQPQDHHDQDHQAQNHQNMYDRGRSEGWYKKGGHVPAEYNGGSYAVDDWRGQHPFASHRVATTMCAATTVIFCW